MRQSVLFTKTQKTITADETSINAQLLIKAGYINKLMAGVYSILPLGQMVMSNIEQIIRQEMNAIDGQEVSLPALQPKENWQITGRWDSFDVLYKLQDDSGREFALGPTHEEVIVPLVKHYIQSYKDLPVAIYQFQTKFRKELRSKSGILRGREFMMKDLYSFHASLEDLDTYYERAKQAYLNIYKRCGIEKETYVTYASGGSFSKYSHEFQTITSAGEDIIYICQQCSLAINKEMRDETPSCPECQSNDFVESKAIEVGNIFKLNTKYSIPFGLQYTSEHGTAQDVIMGCYGIGLGRLMGTIVEVHHDKGGIVWPEEISPYKFHLINLNKDSVQSDSVYQTLQKAGCTVLYDDRELSAGQKLTDADLLGITHRLIVGSKTPDKSVEYKHRAKQDIELFSIEELIQHYV